MILAVRKVSTGGIRRRILNLPAISLWRLNQVNSLQEKLRVVAEEHLGPLTERRDTLRAELAEVEKEIDAAEKAIAAASRSVDQAAAPAAKKTKKRAPQKASAPRDHVLKTIETVLADAGGKLDRDELLVETKEKL
ncbi:MAG: hypothetical protein AAF805_07040, partial [Planctomycetota bacterium]